MRRASSNPRLSEAPQRVTDNRMSMAYATPLGKQPSFGKLSVPKPQSSTSDRRTSFFGNRTSEAGLARSSTLGAFGGAEKMKDVRPLHDKAFVQLCIKQLSEFLLERGFPGSLTTKSLTSPSTKEFLKMFEFIYSLLDPTFQLPTSKVEEEVPRVLKDLGYPFALSKSSMFSVGAPHTWPQVLGALIWLIDTVKIYSCMREQDLLFSDFSDSSVPIEEGAEYNKLFMDYTAEAYAKFMQEEADTFEEEDEAYLGKLKKLYNVDEALLASMEEKHHILQEEVERLEKESQEDRLMTKRTEKLKMQTDLQKLQSYRGNLESFKAGLEGKATGLAEELESSGLQLETLRQEQARLQTVLQKQKFTPADIERINREKKELQLTISSLGRALEEAQQNMWNEEIALAKAKDKHALSLSEYHKLARKLKLIPQSAENACGQDFEIKASSEFGPAGMVQYKVQNPLRTLISNVEEECSRLANMKLSLEESVEQVNSNIADKNNDLRQLREQIRRLDEQLEMDMQELAQEEQKWLAEVDSVESHFKRLQKNVTHGYAEAVEQLKAAREQYHLVLQETNEQRRVVTNNLASILDSAANYLTTVEKFMLDQRKRVDQMAQEQAEEQAADLQQLRDMVEAYAAKANSC